METLFCPNCGYNLTGLEEHRCPECGLPFNPALLATSMNSLPKSIAIGETLLRLLWPPGLFLASAACAWMIPQFVILTVIAGLFLLIYGLVNARQLAKRLAATRAYRQGRSVGFEDKSFIRLCSGGLWFCQLFIGVSGCSICAMQSLR